MRPEVDEEEQDKDRGRSQRDGLQKAEKKFTESHSSIIRPRVGGGDVTTRVDLLCRKNGWEGKTRARDATALRVAIPADSRSLPDRSFYCLPVSRSRNCITQRRPDRVKSLNCDSTCASALGPKTA